MFPGLAAGLVVAAAYPPVWPKWGKLTMLVCAGAWVFVVAPIMIGMREEKERTGLSLRQQMRSRADRCVKCGYHLKGNESGTCPECGHVWL